MRDKYIDEAVGFYIIFGYRAGHPDQVDVHESVQGRDVFTGMPANLAEQVVQAQEDFRKRLYDILGNYRMTDTQQVLPLTCRTASGVEIDFNDCRDWASAGQARRVQPHGA